MVNFLPKTVLGKWSVGLIAVFFLSLVVFHFCLKGSDAEKLIALGIEAAAAGGAFVTGIVGIIKSTERAFLVLLSIVTGFIFLMFLIPSCLG
jgi:hypothetical protein